MLVHFFFHHHHHHQIQLVTNGTAVVSKLTFQPTPDDDGTMLKCEGSNPRLTNSAKDDSMMMNVLCKYIYFMFYLYFLLLHIFILKPFIMYHGHFDCILYVD